MKLYRQNKIFFVPSLIACCVGGLLIYSLALIVSNYLKNVNIMLLDVDLSISIITSVVFLFISCYFFHNRYYATKYRLTKTISIINIVFSVIICICSLIKTMFVSSLPFPYLIILLDFAFYAYLIAGVLAFIGFVIIIVNNYFIEYKNTKLGLTLSAIVLTTLVPIFPILTFNDDIYDNQLIAHRGYSAKYFQNSYNAYKGSIEQGFFGCETDVQMDADGMLWCSHFINPFEDQSLRIDKLHTSQISNLYVKTDGNIDTSFLPPNSAFPTTGKLNPYGINVPRDHDNDQLVILKDYLDLFNRDSGREHHPVIELKIDSCLNDEGNQLDPDKVEQYINNFADLFYLNYDTNFINKALIISFSDDLLAALYLKATESQTLWKNTHIMKLLDDGGTGKNLKTIENPNQTFADSTTNYKRWKSYIDGTWANKYAPYITNKVPISIDLYYAFINSQMVEYAHEHSLMVSSWTADYSRTEVLEPLSMAILKKIDVDMLTIDDYFQFS